MGKQGGAAYIRRGTLFNDIQLMIKGRASVRLLFRDTKGMMIRSNASVQQQGEKKAHIQRCGLIHTFWSTVLLLIRGRTRALLHLDFSLVIMC